MKLVETIRFENGGFANLDLHKKRMNGSRKEFFRTEKGIDLEGELIKSMACNSSISRVGLFKCRVTYSKELENIEFIPYEIPSIKSLKIIIDNGIDYSHKYHDRSQLEKLMERKGNCDDILIVKNGLLTDSSFANILFWNGKRWLTPARPLLKGTQRQYLLEREWIIPAEIRLSDLQNFEKARLVNALMRFGDEVDVDLKRICPD